MWDGSVQGRKIKCLNGSCFMDSQAITLIQFRWMMVWRVLLNNDVKKLKAEFKAVNCFVLKVSDTVTSFASSNFIVQQKYIITMIYFCQLSIFKNTVFTRARTASVNKPT